MTDNSSLNENAGSGPRFLIQTNGKVEAFWKIIKNEFFYPNSFESEKDLLINLGDFLFEYNHLRKHGGLNYETPFDKLQKVTELVSYYSANVPKFSFFEKLSDMRVSLQ